MLQLQALGNLTADATLEQAAGKSVCKFTVAVNNRDKDKPAMFIRCALWDKRAESLHQYLTKGLTVYVEGFPKVNAYTDKEGLAKGGLDMTVQDIHFMSRSDKKDRVEDAADDKPRQEAVTAPGLNDDIPF